MKAARAAGFNRIAVLPDGTITAESGEALTKDEVDDFV